MSLRTVISSTSASTSDNTWFCGQFAEIFGNICASKGLSSVVATLNQIMENLMKFKEIKSLLLLVLVFASANASGAKAKYNVLFII